MRRLEIDFEEIAMALESSRELSDYYLDVETGELVVIPAELLALDCDEEDLSSLPDWEQALIPLVREIQGGSERYEPVPQIPSYEIYNLMLEFVETVTDQRLYQLLSVALDGKGAFGRFKRVLAEYPAERQRWYQMKQAAMTGWIKEWLNELGIEPVERKA
ncbi:MAG: UPF0158 family protein [Firmicutes bacterium]|nr:UPF0158 family protein [Bacillota bacterium]